MATVAELKAELKAKGVKGITGKKKAELMAMLEKHSAGLSTSMPKKEKSAYVPKLPKMTKNKSVDKKIEMPKKISGEMQEKLAKAGLRGGTKAKQKYTV